eukprot:s520_g23.t1
MDEWNARYDERRASAEQDETMLAVNHLELHVSPAVDVQATQEVPTMIDTRRFTEVTDHWMPEKLKGMSFTLSPETDIEPRMASLAETMDTLRERIDETFCWQRKVLDTSWKLRRAATQAVMLLLDQCGDDSKSEVLQTKVFTLLLGEKYRSHEGSLFSYNQGAWAPTPNGVLTAADVDFMTQAARRAQAYFAHPLQRHLATLGSHRNNSGNIKHVRDGHRFSGN